MVILLEKTDFIVLYNDLIDYFKICFKHQCIIQSKHFKKQLLKIYGSSS